MERKFHLFWAGMVAAAGAAGICAWGLGTEDGAPSDALTPAVMLGEEDMAEQLEIERNRFRRMTPGEESFVQDLGPRPAAWEEFGSAWDHLPAMRDLATWQIPFSAERIGGATVLRDAAGTELWRGATDFAKGESAGVTLVGSLVDELDWPLYCAAQEELVRRTAAPPDLRDGGDGPAATDAGLDMFVSVAADFSTNPPAFRVGLRWTNDIVLDVFAYGPLHTASTQIVTFTNDENALETWTNTLWHAVEPPLTGFDSHWTYVGTVALTNGDETVLVDSDFPPGRGVVRFYAAFEAGDSDGDGLNDVFETVALGTSTNSPDSDGDGVDDATEYAAGIDPAVSNVWWEIKTTNEISYWQYLGSSATWSSQPTIEFWTNIVGHAPAANRIVKDVKLDGYVDDAIAVDGTLVDFAMGPQTFSRRSLANEIFSLQAGTFCLGLYDCPSPGYSGPNEVRLGDVAGHPLCVEWTWLVPLDIRLEHINTNGAPLVVNPSGSCPNRAFTCQATVLPATFPDAQIFWSCTNVGMSFVGGVTNGRTVQMTGTQPGDWSATVTIRTSTTNTATLHGTILEKKVVPVFLHIVRDDCGQNPASTEEHFRSLLSGANQIWEQAGIEFQLAPSVLYTNRPDWLVISTNDNWQEYGQLQSWSSHTGGIEVYCIRQFQGNSILGLHWKLGTSVDGLTISSNATARVLAHELGHACGLNDVYSRFPVRHPTIFLPSAFLQEAWLQEDWCSDLPNGGYAAACSQPLLVQCLLMLGVDLSQAQDLPAGEIYGLDASGVARGVSVGLSGLGARQPMHW